MPKSQLRAVRRTKLSLLTLGLLSACSAHAGTPVSDVDVILQKIPGGTFFSANKENISCHNREVAGPGLPPPVPVSSSLVKAIDSPRPLLRGSTQECNPGGDALTALRNTADRLMEARAPGSCCDEQILARQLRELQSALETETNLVTEVIRTVAAAAEVLESNQSQPDMPQLTPREIADCLSGLQTYLQLQETKEAEP